MERKTVWVDVAHCTGCGACVKVCPVAAITLVDGKATVDEQACNGCHECGGVCPEAAIQPVVQGELVPAAETPRPLAQSATWAPPPTAYRPQPLAQSVAAGVVVGGVGLLAKAAGAVARAVGRWLARPPSSVGAPGETGMRSARSSPPAAQGRGGAGRGRRGRHRHRGG